MLQGASQVLDLSGEPVGVTNPARVFQQGFATGTPARVAVSITTSTQLLAANPNRRYAYISNNTGSTLFIQFGGAAVASQGFQIATGGRYEINASNLYLGVINAISGANTGSVHVDVFEGTQ